MDGHTITKEGKWELVGIFNKILQVEYDMILSYPRLIDKLVNVEGINDEEVNRHLETLGKESIHHFSGVSKVIELLGGEPVWVLPAVERMVDVTAVIDAQIEKENKALALYKDAIKTCRKYMVQEKSGFFSKLMGKPEEKTVIDAHGIVSFCERHIIDEERHAKLANVCVGNCKIIMEDKAQG